MSLDSSPGSIGGGSHSTCRHCGQLHGVRCPHVSAIEYHPDGSVRRVEFHATLSPLDRPSVLTTFPHLTAMD